MSTMRSCWPSSLVSSTIGRGSCDRHAVRFTAFTLVLACVLWNADFRAASWGVAAAELQIGRAATPITPTEETGGVKRVLDELQAKALVLRQEKRLRRSLCWICPSSATRLSRRYGSEWRNGLQSPPAT